MAHFPVVGLNTERYGISLRIQSEYRKIRTRNNSVFGHFSRIRSEIWRQALKNLTKISVFETGIVFNSKIRSL